MYRGTEICTQVIVIAVTTSKVIPDIAYPGFYQLMCCKCIAKCHTSNRVWLPNPAPQRSHFSCLVFWRTISLGRSIMSISCRANTHDGHGSYMFLSSINCRICHLPFATTSLHHLPSTSPHLASPQGALGAFAQLSARLVWFNCLGLAQPGSSEAGHRLAPTLAPAALQHLGGVPP